MANKQSKYRQLEHFLTMLLALNGAIFVLYLVSAGLGIVVLKILLALFVVVVGGFCLFILYRTKELLRSRSLWLTLSYCSMILLTVVSLICNYPAP